jgi:hypothetical protein
MNKPKLQQPLSQPSKLTLLAAIKLKIASIKEQSHPHQHHLMIWVLSIAETPILSAVFSTFGFIDVLFKLSDTLHGATALLSLVS